MYEDNKEQSFTTFFQKFFPLKSISFEVGIYFIN